MSRSMTVIHLLLVTLCAAASDSELKRLQSWHYRKWAEKNGFLEGGGSSGGGGGGGRRAKPLPPLSRNMMCTGEGACFTPGIQMSLQENGGIIYCNDCNDPHLEGSIMDAWEAFYHPPNYHVDGALVYGIPNDGSAPFLNKDHIRSNIVMVDRGGVAFSFKILHAQEAGATGIIIVDDGSCTDDLDCGSAGSKARNGFGARDSWNYWSKVRIPALVVNKKNGDYLKMFMGLTSIDIPGLGVQLMDEFSLTVS